MPYYRPAIYIPAWLDKIIAAPLLLLRRIWYGYTFRRIPLVNSSKYAIVDLPDYYELSKYTWLAHKKGSSYRAMRLAQEKGYRCLIYMHRQILNPPKNRNVDHINRNGRDNRRVNLRLATTWQNNMNRRRRDGSSRYKGVRYNPKLKKWLAAIGHNYKRFHLGCFESEIDAAKTYDKAAKKYYGEFAYLNFPPPQKPKGLRNKLRALLGIFRKILLIKGKNHLESALIDRFDT